MMAPKPKSGSIIVSVLDPSDDSYAWEEAEIVAGDYCLTVNEPCYLDGVQTYKNGTVVLRLKNHLGKGEKSPEILH